MSSEHKVCFEPYNKEINVKDGTNLIRAAMDAGVHINASCGGEGVCGKCRIHIEEGEVEGGLSERVSQEDIDKGVRLACKANVTGDITVRIPSESIVDESALLKAPPRKTARIQEADLDELKEKGLFLPPIEKFYLELPLPDTQDHLPDVTRLVLHLQIQYEEHRLQLNLDTIRKLPDILREEDFCVTVTLERAVRKKSKTRITNIQPGNTTGRNFSIAIDIGTTTVYGQILDNLTGEVMAQYGVFNGQVSYGEDVISRLVFAEKPGGLDTLHKAVIESINKILTKLVKTAEVACDEISSITLAGNTTMTQLLLKVNPRYIRRAPYVPAATLYPPVRAADLGMNVADHVSALVFPQISSYVGGDIVAGVMGSGMYRTEKLTLFIDIGTNAEIVVGNKDWMACAACSAGPALEGGGIEFGMRAQKGAIEDCSINPVNLEPMNLTIGNVRPKGICGSGLITIAATMFELGIINNQGKFERELDTKRIRDREGIWEFVLAWADETQIGRDITLNEIDIENMIRAKGAIYSGCQTLLDEVGLGMSDIEQILLAGGFGSYIDLEKAMTIGLLPEMDPEKVIYIGNSSLMGAKMSSLTNQIRRDVGDVTVMMTNFELSETPSYMDHYIAALFLPHTDVNLFPKLKARMDENSRLRAEADDNE